MGFVSAMKARSILRSSSPRLTNKTSASACTDLKSTRIYGAKPLPSPRQGSTSAAPISQLCRRYLRSCSKNADITLQMAGHQPACWRYAFMRRTTAGPIVSWTKRVDEMGLMLPHMTRLCHEPVMTSSALMADRRRGRVRRRRYAGTSAESRPEHDGMRRTRHQVSARRSG